MMNFDNPNVCLQRAIKCQVKEISSFNKYFFAPIPPPLGEKKSKRLRECQEGQDTFELILKQRKACQQVKKARKPEFCLWLKMSKVHVLHATIMIVYRGSLNRYMSTLASTATERSRRLT